MGQNDQSLDQAQMNQLMNTLYDRVGNMKQKLASIEQNAKVDLEQWQSQITSNINAAKESLTQRANELQNEYGADWQKVADQYQQTLANIKDQWNTAVENIQDATRPKSGLEQSIDNAKASLAQENAEMSIRFALNAVSEAEDALAQAIKAKVQSL